MCGIIKTMNGDGGIDFNKIGRRIRACDYLVVAQLFLQDNFLLEHKLTFDDIKPRPLGHWGTCHGIDVAYANLKAFFCPTPDEPTSQPANDKVKNALDSLKKRPTANIDTGFIPEKSQRERDNFHFILGPGHGFPALQANLFVDGDLELVDPKATRDSKGIEYLCKNFSWPGGFPSHASPITPGVICEGGELGYALGAAYGLALGHPEKTIAVMLGDGEFETATALASLNLVKTIGNNIYNGKVIPILHLNGYKISGPTIYGRKSEREMKELIRGFGYTPLWIEGDSAEEFQGRLREINSVTHPFLILQTKKGATGPTEVEGKKVAGNFLAHQIPLPEAKTNPIELDQLKDWLMSYKFEELFDPKKGFAI